MSGLVAERAAAVRDAVASVAWLRVFDDPAAVSSPPAAYVGPPQLRWGAMCAPTDAEFTVYLVMAASERAQERLLDLLPVVATAIDGVVDAVVTSARPGVFAVGGADLPAYEVSVSVAL